jgi:hypothetical protein
MTRALTTFRERLLDGADLVIDFATLGEYGLEPVEAECRRDRCAPGRSRDGSPRLERFPDRDRAAA